MSAKSDIEGQTSPDKPSNTVKDDVVPRPQLQLHDVWQCEVVVFQVENRLFSVLKQGLSTPGSVFADMFALPTDSQVEGRNVENPIVLRDTNASDFEAFLSVLYPSLAGKRGAIKTIKGDMISDFKISLSINQWFGALTLANKWNYPEVRNLAIASLDNLLPRDARKIRLGKQYQVEDWVKEGYYGFVSKAGLQIDELAGAPNNLDHETIAKIFYIQAASIEHLGGTYCQGSALGCGYNAHNSACNKKRNGLKDARVLIDTAFKDDIASAYYNPETKVG